jgi:hypothetical protein
VGIFVFSLASKVKQSRVCAVVEWKDGRKTRHSLANVLRCGGDEGCSLSQVGKMKEKIDLFFSAVNQLE